MIKYEFKVNKIIIKISKHNKKIINQLIGIICGIEN